MLYTDSKVVQWLFYLENNSFWVVTGILCRCFLSYIYRQQQSNTRVFSWDSTEQDNVTKIKVIYWFPFYNDNSPSIRYRGQYLLKELNEKKNINYYLVFPGYTITSIYRFVKAYAGALFSSEKSSLIVFQKICSNGIYARLLKFLTRIKKTNTVYELDDADHLRFPVETMNFFLSRCAAVSVGSQDLKRYVSKFNSKVFVATSPVPDHSFTKKPSGIFTVGWIGDYGISDNNEQDYSHKKTLFSLLFPALRNIDFPIRFVLMGVHNERDKNQILEYFKENTNLQIEIPLNINWKDDNFLFDKISEFDFGFSPLIDHEFNRGKSAFKTKQYLSCGIPVIGSSTGENKFFLINCYNGFVCDNVMEFETAIRRAFEMSADEYEKLSSNALADKHIFSLERVSNFFLEQRDDNEITERCRGLTIIK